MHIRSGMLFTALVAGSCCSQVMAQSKAFRKMEKQIRADITLLASDSLEGRRTGMDGEVKAANYIESRYKGMKIGPYKNQYRHPFQFIYGKEVVAGSAIRVGGAALVLNEECFPLPFSASKRVTSEILPDVMEQGSVWMVPLYSDPEQAKDAHFNWEKTMFERAKEAERQGASGVLFYDNFGSKYEPTYNRHSEYESIGIPVAFLLHKGYKQHIAEGKNQVSIELNITLKKAERSGTNLAAYIDNKAKYTVVLGGHYDHLGYGEDGNSLHANATKEHQIHHGADDNASGTAAVLAMAKWIKSKKLHNYNYLFLNFSGEELGLFGSKMFVKEQGLDSNQIAYMINMDMVGRLNDSTHALTVGGIGTSPAWSEVVNMAGPDFKVVIDSSGIGPSDHTSFYNAGIPVLFFFSGTHKDYHKPTDVADLINYDGETKILTYVSNVVGKMDKEKIKPTYTVTKQKSTGGRSSFKVTLGVMPDYTYQDGGLKVDGVTDNRPAAKAGVKAGDIITKLGDVKILGMGSYMEALGKFAPGDKTQITLIRAGQEMTLPIEMMAK